MGTVLMSAYGWFAGLLSVMIVITVLFAVILYIALRPATKGDIGIKQLLARREAEITAEILNNKDDKAKTDALMVKLREVEAAENLIKELVGDDDEQEPQDSDKKKFDLAGLFKGKKSKPATDAKKNTPAVKEAAAADAKKGAAKTDKK